MKLHKDGTVEGTPSEIAEYNKLQMEKKEQFKVIPPTGVNPNEHQTEITSAKVDARYPGSGIIYVGTVTPKVSMNNYNSPDEYVRGLLSAIGKGQYH